jgi:hypothetical protein
MVSNRGEYHTAILLMVSSIEMQDLVDYCFFPDHLADLKREYKRSIRTLGDYG